MLIESLEHHKAISSFFASLGFCFDNNRVVSINVSDLHVEDLLGKVNGNGSHSNKLLPRIQ